MAGVFGGIFFPRPVGRSGAMGCNEFSPPGVRESGRSFAHRGKKGCRPSTLWDSRPFVKFPLPTRLNAPFFFFFFNYHHGALCHFYPLAGPDPARLSAPSVPAGVPVFKHLPLSPSPSPSHPKRLQARGKASAEPRGNKA